MLSDHFLSSSIYFELCDCVCCSYEKGKTLTRVISPFPLAGYIHPVVTPISVTSNNMAEMIQNGQHISSPNKYNAFYKAVLHM